MSSIVSTRESAREIAIRRFDRLPEVPPAGEPGEDGMDEDQLSVAHRQPRPGNIDEAIETIRHLSDRCRTELREMQSGIASRIVDRHYLIVGGIAFFVLWSLCAFTFGPQPPWVPVAAGVPVAIVLGFTVYLVLHLPLQKKTGRIYPRIERISQAAEGHAGAAKSLATRRNKPPRVNSSRGAIRILMRRASGKGSKSPNLKRPLPTKRRTSGNDSA